MNNERKREEPKLGEPKLGEPRLVEPEAATESGPEINIAQKLQGESVSDTLIRARQQVGQDLRSIAEVLCIRYSYLDAIERGEHDSLPGATYAVGFVRSYAEYLGLDGDQVVERFKSEVEGLDSQTQLHFPTPAPEGKMPGGAVFLVAALLFAGAYGVWYYLSNSGDGLGDLVAPVPERLQEFVDGDAPRVAAQADGDVTEGPAAAATPAETSPAAVPETPAPSAAETAEEAVAVAPDAPEVAENTPAAPEVAEDAPAAPPTETATAEIAPAETAPPESSTSEAQTAAAAPEAPEVPAEESAVAETPASETPAAETPARDEPLAIPAAPDDNAAATAFLTDHEPQVYGTENDDARIVLKATQDAWVQVRDRQGTLLLTRVLRVGDTYRVPDEGDLTLLTGNAGGLEITVDGRALAPLGPVGAVRRNIPLNPESLLGGAGR